jgi:hypothetical protein
MDVESLAKQLILQNMTPEQQTAVLDSIRASVTQAKDVQKQRIGENVQVVVQALKKLEADIKARYDETGKAIEKRVATIKDGKDGRNGVDGKVGKDGRAGRDGATGPRGADGLNGRDGRDGENGISVTDAHIDFDGSLIIGLSSGRIINVGEVVAPDVAEKIKIIANGGGTSQTVIDALASLQTQINELIPSQTGNAGKFLTTDGTDVSWAEIVGGLDYQGTWNATTNTPTLASGVGTNGFYYVVATAGSTNLDGITDWQIGDWAIYNGTAWQKIDQTNLVTSVAGRTGAITLANTDISGLGTMSTQASSSVSITGGSITGITDLAIADGGTGQSTANAAFNALAPSQTSNSGKYLKTNGTNTSWEVVPEPAAATPTDDGLVYGVTSNVDGAGFSGFADYVTPYIFFSTANYFIAQIPVSPPPGVDIIGDWNAWVAANIDMGMPIYGQKAGYSKLYYGVVTFITGGTSGIDPAIFYVSNPNSNPNLPYFYPTNFTFSSPVTATNGNTSLGYQSNNSGGKNTVVGYDSGSTITSGYNLTIVGYNSEPSSATVGNEATFGNSATTNTRLFGSLAMGGSSTGTAGQVLTSAGSGTAPTWSTPASSGVTSVTGTSPVVSSGGTTPAISLASGYGDTLNPYASKTANYVLAAPNGSSGVPTFRAVVAADIPTLNQNTTGTASNVTGTVAVANGGTGATTAGDALTNLGAIGTITSTDGSVTVTTSGTSRDLSVAVSGSTTNVVCLVRNTTGATLTKGTAVYISGATGQNPTVSKALANADSTSAQTLGLMTANLANNSNGYVTVIGLVTDIDTSAYTDGDQLYLSPTTAGTLTATKPYAPQHLVYLAVVEHAHPTQGKLFVKVQNGYEMDELHNVSAQSPSNGQSLVYNTSTSLWEKNTVSLSIGVNGTLPIANGGTGQTTATAAFNALAPSQSSNSGKYLTTDGTNSSWATVVSGATVANDTSTTTNLYPLFANATSGTPTTIYTGNTYLLYKPSTGELQARVPVASNGIFVNSQTVSTSYTIATGFSGSSAGPITVASGAVVTVGSGSRWIVS